MVKDFKIQKCTVFIDFQKLQVKNGQIGGPKNFHFEPLLHIYQPVSQKRKNEIFQKIFFR